MHLPLLEEALLLFATAGTALGFWTRARRRERAAHEALRESEERFRHLTSVSADWFWETDPEHRIAWLSGGPAVAALLGPERAHGRRFWDIPGLRLSPESLIGHLERQQTSDTRMPLFDFEVSRLDGAGGLCVHEVSGRPRFDAAGHFLGYRGVGRDVSERRRASRALSEAKERLELATEGGNVAVWDCDIGSRRVYLDRGWARLTGEREGDRTASLDDMWEMVHAEDRAALGASFVRALKGPDPANAEFRIRTASGDWRWLHAMGRVTERARDGRGTRLTGTITDIDARRRAEQALREAEAHYRKLIELSPDGIIVTSGGVFEYANAAAARLLRAPSARELIGKRREDFVHPDHLDRHRERIAYLSSGPGATAFEERRIRCMDGEEIVIETAGVSYLERGRLVVQTVIRDVSEQRKARQALAEREQRFRDVVEASGEYVWETDANWRYTFLSQRVESVLGYPRAEMIGRTPRAFMPLGEAQPLDDWFARRENVADPFRDLVHRSITKSGRVIWQSVSGVPVFDAAGALVGYRGTGADITARKLAEERIQYLATRDALTGLPNRALLSDRAGQMILSAARSRGSLAVLVLDLDRFILINDTLGYATGDALLRAVGERLAGTLRRDDTLGRIGGDKFVLLWDGAKGPQEGAKEAANLAQRTLGVLARPFTVDGHSLNVSASIGISVYPNDGRDFGELLKNADAATHEAKASGAGGFRFFSADVNARAVARLSMENDLRRALARGEFVLHWQPVVGTPSRGAGGRMVGAEALLRWPHPEQGLRMPDQFIAVAEESGLIGALGQWTLERVLSQAGAWHRDALRRGQAPLWFALNVSARELAQGEAYVERLAAALEANGLPGDCVELEVTERVLMAHLEENVRTLRRIGALGVRVAIDDFGTGYSSLAYLRQLPIDKLKIDRSFLRELDARPDDAPIVTAISAMARALGLRVAAEGVETQAQLARLEALGCEEWQGHHFSEPLDTAAFDALLAREAKRDAAVG